MRVNTREKQRMMEYEHMMETEAAARGTLKENYEEWYQWPSNGSVSPPDGNVMLLSPDSNFFGAHNMGVLVMPLEQHAIFTGHQWNINPAYNGSVDASYSPPEELGAYVTSDFNMPHDVTGFDARIHHFVHSMDNQSILWPPCESEMSLIAINNLKLNPFASEFIPRSGNSSPVEASSTNGSNYAWEQAHTTSDLQHTSITSGLTGSVIPDVNTVEPEDNIQQRLHECIPATSQNDVQVACLSQREYPIYRSQPTEPQHVQVFGTMPATDCVNSHPLDYIVPSFDLRNGQPETRFPNDEQSHGGHILSRASATLSPTYSSQRASTLSSATLPPTYTSQRASTLSSATLPSTSSSQRASTLSSATLPSTSSSQRASTLSSATLPPTYTSQRASTLSSATLPSTSSSQRASTLSSATLPSTSSSQRASTLSSGPPCTEFINQVPYNMSLLNKYFGGSEYQASQRSETADSDLHCKPGHTANETTAGMDGINNRNQLGSKIIKELKKLPGDSTEGTPKREAVARVLLQCITQYADQNTVVAERQNRVIQHLASRFDTAVLSTERWQDKCLRAATEHEEKKKMHQLKIAELHKQIAAEKEKSIYCQMLAQAPQGQAMYDQGVDTSVFDAHPVDYPVLLN